MEYELYPEHYGHDEANLGHQKIPKMTQVAILYSFFRNCELDLAILIDKLMGEVPSGIIRREASKQLFEKSIAGVVVTSMGVNNRLKSFEYQLRQSRNS